MTDACTNHKETDGPVMIAHNGKGKVFFVCCDTCASEKLDLYYRNVNGKGLRYTGGFVWESYCKRKGLKR